MVEPSAEQTTGHRAGGRPPAIVSIGVTGHRRIAGGAASAAAVAVELGRTIDSLKAAADRQLGAEGSGGETQLRLVTMLAQGADLLAASQARQRAVPVAAILPGTVEAFRATFDRSGSVRKLDKQLSAVRWLCELPCQVVDDIAFERANALILAQSDVLVAVWDGKPARGRAGTGDVVQAALNLGIPILVIDPAGKKETALIPTSDALLLPRRATEFPRFAARLAFAPIVAPIVSPPRRTDQRSALQDFLAEPVEPRTWRFEHKLLTLLGGTIEAAGADGGAEAGPAGRSPMGDHDPARRIDKEFQHADRLANHYGQLMRSTQVSRFFLIALAACLNAAVSLLLPAFQPASTVIQMAITIVSLFDDRWARRRRWHERWLDYRSMAERLRCLRYLQPLGLGDDIFRPSKRGRPQHWSDWYLARLVRELGPPAGHLQESEIRERLAFVHHEIGDQISYHRRALKRFARLDRRLGWIATGSLVVTIAAGGISVLAPLLSPVPSMSLPLAAVGLIVLLGPAFAASASGLRGAADLARLAQRSANTTTALGRLRRSLDGLPAEYDHLVAAARLSTRAMVQEMFEWRFVLESRRPARLKLRRPKRR